jgi:rubrerythrin
MAFIPGGWKDHEETPPVQAEDVFRNLIKFARASADLYYFWAETFQDDSEAAFVWGRMAAEEVGHANLVVYQRRILRKSAGPSGDVDAAMDEVTVLIDIVRRALEGPPHTLDEAVRLASWIEASAAGSELQSALTQSDPGIQKLLEHLGTDDRMHVERLKAFAAGRRIALFAPKAQGGTADEREPPP